MQTRKHYYHDVSTGDGGYCHTCETARPEGETWTLAGRADLSKVPRQSGGNGNVMPDACRSPHPDHPHILCGANRGHKTGHRAWVVVDAYTHQAKEWEWTDQ